MVQNTKVKKTGRGRRREWVLGVGLMAWLIGLVFRIPLSRMIGDKGIGFFAAAMEIFAVSSAVMCYGISKAVAILVKYRAKRDMYKSARKIYQSALVFTVLLSALAALFVFFFSEFIAQTFVLEYRGYLAIAAIAPAIFLSGLLGVMRGYLQGMGAMMPTVHSRLLEKFIMLVAGLLLAAALFSYGEKVAALLRDTEYAAAYGAMGASIGVSIACGVAILHMLLIRLIYAGTFKQQMMGDTAKYVESNGQVISTFFSAALPYMVCALLYNIHYLVDQRVFNYVMNKQEKGSVRVAHWGVYYGKYSVVTGIVAIVCTMAVISAIPRIAQMYDKQEYGEVKYRIGSAVHNLAVLTIPCAVWVAVLAEPIVGMLFKGDQDTAVKLLQAGSGVIVFFTFGYFLMLLMQRIRKIRMVILGGLAAFLIHLVFLFILISSTELGIVAVAFGLMVFWLVVCATGFIGIVQYMQYSPEWIRTFGVTAVASGVSGLAGMLLSKVMISWAGGIITFFVCIIVCILIYLVLMIVLRGIREDELEDMPGGRIIIGLAEKMRLL